MPLYKESMIISGGSLSCATGCGAGSRDEMRCSSQRHVAYSESPETIKPMYTQIFLVKRDQPVCYHKTESTAPPTNDTSQSRSRSCRRYAVLHRPTPLPGVDALLYCRYQGILSGAFPLPQTQTQHNSLGPMASRGPSEVVVVEQGCYAAARQTAQDTDPRIRAQRRPHQSAVC